MKRTILKKTARQPRQRQQKEQPITQQQPGGCLVRIYWLFFGNALAALFALAILQGEGGLGLADLFYWLGAASLIVSRYVDIRYLSGRTAEGEPATMRDWQNYSLYVVGVAAIVWLAVHAVDFFSG